MTHEEFLIQLYNNNERYRIGDFTVKGEYTKNSNKVLLGTKYGDVAVQANHLLSGSGFTIESAVDKTEFAKNKLIEVYGDCFDLSRLKYTKTRDVVEIGCSVHGFLEVRFGNFMNRGCPKCGIDLSKESYKSNGGWHDSKWGAFAKTSLNFDSFKVYVVKCFDETEEFYKIGKTFCTLKERFKGIKKNVVLPYNWEEVNVYTFDNAKDTCCFERDVKKLLKQYQYKPNKWFSGYRECYSKII